MSRGEGEDAAHFDRRSRNRCTPPVEIHHFWYTSTIALNIKDSDTEKLAAEVAALAGETKTRAVRVALEQRKERLLLRSAPAQRRANLRRFLEDEAWPQIPRELLGRRISRKDREAILGYGPTGV